MRRAVLALCAVMGMMGSAGAVDYDVLVHSGNDLMPLCAPQIEAASYVEMLAYVTGIAAVLNNENNICIPPNTGAYNLRTAVCNGLVLNPQERQDNAAYLTEKYLAAMFPCKNSGN